MNRRTLGLTKATGWIVAGLAVTSPAWAYLDPGTGSLLLQGLLGSIAIAGAAIVRFRAYLSHYLSKFIRKRE